MRELREENALLLKKLDTQTKVAQAYKEALSDAYRPYVSENNALRGAVKLLSDDADKLDGLKRILAYPISQFKDTLAVDEDQAFEEAEYYIQDTLSGRDYGQILFLLSD